jgi:hypothetical protein
MYGFTVPLSGTTVSNIANLYPYKLILCQYKLAMLLRNLVGTAATNFVLAKSGALSTLDELFAFSAGRSLTRALLHEWKSLDGWAGAIDCQCKAFSRSETCREARRNGLISAEDAANLSDIPNVRQRGNRLGNWLTRERAKELLQVPDR